MPSWFRVAPASVAAAWALCCLGTTLNDGVFMFAYALWNRARGKRTLNRRLVLAVFAAALASAPAPLSADDAPTLPVPPVDDRAAFIAMLSDARGEPPELLAARFDLARLLAADGSLFGDAVSAFLLTPRHLFVEEGAIQLAYLDTPLRIGWGQTISAPHMVARMTAELDVAPGDRVLEIGTGSGYQAAMLATQTSHVYSIEIVEPLAARTAALFERLIDAGYTEYEGIHLATGDGYFGWPEHAPFNHIIVTAAIDHIPPPLIDQLADGGTMLIPVGPPASQLLLEVTRSVAPDGTVSITRRDVYEGRGRVRFVPFTRTQ